MELIQPLFTGPLDIIGDVHGEYGALCSLLLRLGYDGNGFHPEGRRLIFVGDLIDRGPDSIAVVKLVKHFIEQGRAQCVIGNHELNILRPGKNDLSLPDKRHGNHWFQALPEELIKNSSKVSFQVFANAQDRQELTKFFLSLPIALEREDLKIVHACWHQPSIEKLRGNNKNAKELFLDYEHQINQSHPTQASPIERDLREQNLNPIKVLTSGLEARAEAPYETSGKVRHLKRVSWWKDYSGPMVVFGHYWRKRSANPTIPKDILSPPGKASVPDLFTGTPQFAKMGRTMCIDYSVGARYYERHNGYREGDFGSYLGALRTNKTNNDYGLLFDDGKEISRI